MSSRDEIYDFYRQEPWRRCPTEAALRDRDIVARMKADEADLLRKGLVACPVCGVPRSIGQKSYCGHRERYLEAKK